MVAALSIDQKQFNIALVTAAILHLLVLILIAINFNSDDIKINYKPILVKLGQKPEAVTGSAQQNRKAFKTAPKPVIKSPLTQPSEVIPETLPSIRPVPRVKPSPKIQSTAKIEEVKKPKPSENVRQQKSSVKARPVLRPTPPTPFVKQYPLLPTPRVSQHRTIRPPVPVETPFVENFSSERQEAKAQISGHELGNRTKAEQKVIFSYEQQLSLWLAKHKTYPTMARRRGLEGNAVIRLQIDRMGNVRFFELAERTHYSILDTAIISMIKRSDPVPPVPENYPAGNIIEFLLPVTFTLH